jgi:hypothetical protein
MTRDARSQHFVRIALPPSGGAKDFHYSISRRPLDFLCRVHAVHASVNDRIRARVFSNWVEHGGQPWRGSVSFCPCAAEIVLSTIGGHAPDGMTTTNGVRRTGIRNGPLARLAQIMRTGTGLRPFMA